MTEVKNDILNLYFAGIEDLKYLLDIVHFKIK